MSRNVIVISGTPGTGKTSVARLLSNAGFNTMNLFDIAKADNLLADYDDAKDIYVIEDDALQHHLKDFLLNQNLIILESHYGDLVPQEFVIHCFVLVSNPADLKSRYLQRGYSTQKIEENLEAEIMQECYFDAVEVFGENRVTKLEGLTIREMSQHIQYYITSEVVL